MAPTSALTHRARRAARALRHLPDRVLHGRRRSAAAARLAASDPPGRAVFICHGNINRSAYAAAAFARAMPSHARAHTSVSSMGFIGPNRRASELAQRVAERRGIDLSTHRSRQLDAPELRSTDLIVVMDVRQRDAVANLVRRRPEDILILGDMDPDGIDTRTIQDPYGHPEEVFERVFDRLDRCVAELVRSVWRD